MSWMGNSQSGSRSGPETAMDVRSQPVKSHQACSVEAGLGQPSQHVWVSIKEAGGRVQAQPVPASAASPWLRSSSWGRGEPCHLSYLAPQWLTSARSWPCTQSAQLPNSARDAPRRRMRSGPQHRLPGDISPLSSWLANKITQGETPVYKSLAKVAVCDIAALSGERRWEAETKIITTLLKTVAFLKATY